MPTTPAGLNSNPSPPPILELSGQPPNDHYRNDGQCYKGDEINPDVVVGTVIRVHLWLTSTVLVTLAPSERSASKRSSMPFTRLGASALLFTAQATVDLRPSGRNPTRLIRDQASSRKAMAPADCAPVRASRRRGLRLEVRNLVALRVMNNICPSGARVSDCR